MKRQLRVIENAEFSPEPQSETRLGAEPSSLRRNPTPQTRADCIDGPRPCQFVSCRHHMHARQKRQHPRTSTYQSEATCSLDIAAEGNHTLDEVGTYLGITRERVRQIETKAMVKVREALGRRGYAAADVHDALASHGENTEPEGLE